jgi:hypothetical protein
MRCICGLRTPVSSKASACRTPTHQTLVITPPACLGLRHLTHKCDREFPSTLLPLLSSINRTLPSQRASDFRIYDRLPPTPATPNTDFKNLFNSLRQRDAFPLHTAKVVPSEVPSVSLPISPPPSPAVSRTSSSSRQQRPVLFVQTSSPVGTSAPPSTPVLPSPCPSASQLRPSGRLPKRPPLPVWSAEHYPRAVVV